MEKEQPLPRGGPSREAIAIAEVGHTDVSPQLARAVVGIFIVAVAIVPLAELRAVWARTAEVLAVHAAKLSAVPPNQTAWQRLLANNRVILEGLTEFERAIEDESVIGRTLRPHAQAVMTGKLAVGNERVYAGRAGWLFYRPDVEYVTGQPFLDPAQIRRRSRAAPEWAAPPAPDPRPAIVRLKEDLAARGIVLIVMPTPVKPSVHPEMMSAGLAGTVDAVHNASYRTLVDDLRAAGVIVFDPSESLAAARHAAAQYLASDTHWTPEAMETAASLAAGVVSNAATLPPVPDPGYVVERVETRSIGDTAKMLDLPDPAALFPPETVWLRRILQPDGSLWRSSRDADVLLLGDSFSNIFSLESMAWGTSAGFAEQLSFALRRPIDRLVQNDDAAFATRAMLQREPARLEGKRVVIYQFAARELAQGDWKVLPIVR
jgi:SGNH hydrolase-like domain, acetyltransferase AlgX